MLRGIGARFQGSFAGRGIDDGIKRVMGVAVLLMLPVVGHSAITLTQAQITKVVKDVRTVDPGKGARPAIVKETVRGQQAVRTGLESRTELLFNDNTITRLGANTHFSFSEGTRNMSLDNGTMLLQVPKGIGGARIETAAVTAGITGTTIMLEAGKNYTKLIVLEGECCLWPKKVNKGSQFRHKICAGAGQEIIVHNGSDDLPQTAYVNLKIIEKTSLLLYGKWGVNLDNGPIIAAANRQGSDYYIPTHGGPVGAGADNVITLGKLPQNPQPTSNPPPTGVVPATVPSSGPSSPPPPPVIIR